MVIPPLVGLTVPGTLGAGRAVGEARPPDETRAATGGRT